MASCPHTCVNPQKHTKSKNTLTKIYKFVRKTLEASRNIVDEMGVNTQPKTVESIRAYISKKRAENFQNFSPKLLAKACKQELKSLPKPAHKRHTKLSQITSRKRVENCL